MTKLKNMRYLDNNSLFILQRFLRSFSDLGTDRHRPAPLPTPGAGTSGIDRHVPASNGTDRHRPARTGTGPAPCRHDINFDYLVVNTDKYQFLEFFFSLK